MEVISFTGRSGTGKSYRATTVAARNNCDAIIDDGLLIYKGQIVAGSSAKKCKSKAAAMRTALFDLDKVRRDVQRGLVKYHPERLLVLGTSDRMTDWICDALGIKHASRRIYIEDVSTPEERKTAAHSRNVDGQHVIPASMVQLKRDFLGYFINPLRLFSAAADNNPETSIGEMAAAAPVKLGEMAVNALTTAQQAQVHALMGNDLTVVRPVYSSGGSFTVSEQVIRDIVSIVTAEHDTMIVLLKQLRQGKEYNLTLHLELCVLDSPRMIEVCTALQQEIRNAIEGMTSFTVSRVNIRIVELAADYTDLHLNR